MVADKDVFKGIIMQRREAEFQVGYCWMGHTGLYAAGLLQRPVLHR